MSQVIHIVFVVTGMNNCRKIDDTMENFTCNLRKITEMEILELKNTITEMRNII